MKRNIIILTFIVMLITAIYCVSIKINEQSKYVVSIKANNITEIKLLNYNNEKEDTYEITETTTENITKSITKDYILLPKDTTPIISKMGYKVNTQNLKDIDEKKEKNVVINYPQLTGFKNKSIQNQINKTIKDAALKPYYYGIKKYGLNCYDNTERIVDYTIEYIDKNIISIVFRGYSYEMVNKEMLSVYFGIYTVNVNLHTGNIINIDELFENSYKKIINCRDLDSYYFYNNTAYLSPYKYDLEYIYEPYNEETDFVAFYSDSYDKNNNRFFIKENGFVFITPGNSNSDYMYVANYDDLMDSIKWENEVWAGIFKKERG